jgi:hypothetical protein
MDYFEDIQQQMVEQAVKELGLSLIVGDVKCTASDDGKTPPICEVFLRKIGPKIESFTMKYQSKEDNWNNVKEIKRQLIAATQN